jgi:chromosome segregation ATPase
MPTINQIRFTNVVYEDGMKRYNDEIFKFAGYNGAILLENGGGKTVFIQTALQAVLPHTSLANRKIMQTLQLENYPAHIAIEWILSERPRRYLVTCVSLFTRNGSLDSYRYVYPYLPGDKHSIENIPFVRKDSNRPADRGEISDYYQQMSHEYMDAHTFSTIREYLEHLEEQYHIIAKEWESIVKINSTEGGVEAFFEECKQTNQLFDRLLIPTVESAIAGHDVHTFADTFEKHRDSFKMYKQLKAQIEENKAIEAELNRYVQVFNHLHEAEADYEHTKGQAKAFMQLITEQENDYKAKEKETREKLLQWEEENNTYRKKRYSLNIQQEQLQLNKILDKWKDVENQYTFIKEKRVEAENTFYSLKLARMKKELKIEQERIDSLKRQLDELVENEEITELENQLQENSQELMGYFTNELAELDRQMHSIKHSRKPLEDQMAALDKELQNKRESLQNQHKAYNTNEGILSQLEADLQQIRQQILSNPDQENVKQSLKQWELRFNQLDQEIVQAKDQCKQMEKEIQQLNLQKEALDEQKRLKENEQAKLSTELEQTEYQHQRLKDTLTHLKPQWATIDLLYLKEDSIQKQLEEMLEKLKKNREDCLYKERLAYRFMDDYGNQDLFFADSFLEKHIKSWQNQFTLLQTGVQFVHSLDKSANVPVEQYVLWPITLITTTSEVAILKEKIQHIKANLQFPIIVLSLEEARAMVQEGENVGIKPIIPSHWSTNLEGDNFDHWKREIAIQAEQSTNARKKVEDELQTWTKVYEQFIVFFKEFPYEDYQLRKENLAAIQQRIHQVNVEIQEIGRKARSHEDHVVTLRERIEAFTNEYNGLQGKLEKANLYIGKEKELLNIKSRQNQLREMIEDINQAIQRLTQQKERLQDDIQGFMNEENQCKINQAKIFDHPLYVEVKNHPSKFTNKELAVLAEEREELKYAIRRVSRSKNELDLKLEQARENEKRIQKEINGLRKEHDQFDETVDFPLNGEEKMEFLLERKKQLSKEEKIALEQVEQWKTKKLKQENKLEAALHEFDKEFPDEDPYLFEDSLTDVASNLDNEEKQLIEKRHYINHELERVEKELANIAIAYKELDRFEEAHHFNGPSVKANLLSEKDIQAFTYGRVKYVNDITDQLRNGKVKVEKELESVEKAKDTFKNFCKSKITNVKMREMAIRGVDNKKTYKEIIEFQQHMQNRIQNAIKYNEESIINHDKQLEQFVTHIHSHLRTVAQELELIPKKTKVKVDEGWKEIYKFSIPNWQDEEGKSRIREYIEWILGQLESEKYRDAEGHEDHGKVRKEIETWLQTKQLLRKVMNNEMMRVTCRKVSNDNQVSSRSYTWEQTNVWSGGEKWSKNMTLFLGILNYVAEKQKHIAPNMKRHRAVILDNPFGKASSDHVLNPVFFIAEQLGFQIIALTAHAEGKFLRDFFPVIYSCRLKQAENSNKQIMTKVKHVHKAYFQDHEPQALERLGEVEQLELF